MKTATAKTAPAKTAPAKTAPAKTAPAKGAARTAKPAVQIDKAVARTDQRAAPARPASAAHPALKVVRDGFTMPQADYDQLKALKASCLKRGVEVKKSELLRAGLQALSALSSKELDARIRALAPVKAGRKKNKV